MAKNTIVGKNKRKGSTKATGRNLAYQAAYNKRRSEVKRRVELNRYNRKKKTYGNKDKKDASHKNGRIVGFEAQSRNRARKKTNRVKYKVSKK